LKSLESGRVQNGSRVEEPSEKASGTNHHVNFPLANWKSVSVIMTVLYFFDLWAKVPSMGNYKLVRTFFLVAGLEMIFYCFDTHK